jgi:hypothetical protein
LDREAEVHVKLAGRTRLTCTCRLVEAESFPFLFGQVIDVEALGSDSQ